ncbi:MULTISPECIES: hypothetical protein [Acidithrix]|uniref:TadE-like protein n=1 Tax=Acidithrix ferrooxidans TaxID=1280514 RepID=A0A0D8HHE8_9ACTN|nr:MULTISPECIES: hypothetical protein [Acidithrix]KJF16491.1 hypothetical protein AXFE_26560 [Acidithrix ferrooxidans]CAG4928944.1 unnamed protein product [Acidithrix sp. C25]
MYAIAKDESGVIDVALAIIALVIVLGFSSYIFAITSVTQKYSSGISQTLRNLVRTAQIRQTPLSQSESFTLAASYLQQLGISSSTLNVNTNMTYGGCTLETFTISISNPLIAIIPITSSSTSNLGISKGCP